MAAIVERLFAEAVAGQQQAPPPEVEHRQGEHSAEPIEELLAPLLVSVDERLGVAVVGFEPVATGGERLAEALVVVDFAVEDDPDRAVLVGHRLVCLLGQIDDGQPAMPEEEIGLGAGGSSGQGLSGRLPGEFGRLPGEPPGGDPESIGAAMPDRVERGQAGARIDGPAGRDLSEDSAHRLGSLSDPQRGPLFRPIREPSPYIEEEQSGDDGGADRHRVGRARQAACADHAGERRQGEGDAQAAGGDLSQNRRIAFRASPNGPVR